MDIDAHLAMSLEKQCPWDACATLWTHASWRDLIDMMKAVSPETYEAWKRGLLTDEQPTFPLLAQDITADLVVDFWTLIQMRIWSDLRSGYCLDTAVARARHHFGIPQYPPCLHHPKIDGATRIAWAMRTWPHRRLAD